MRTYSRLNHRLAERYEQWMVIQHYSPSTKHGYRRSVRLFIEFLGGKSLAHVTHLDVRMFIASLSEQGVTLSGACNHLHSLRQFYDFLHLGGIVSYVAPRLVKIRHCPPRMPPHFTEEEVRRLLDAAKTPREKALAEFLYGSGCRLSEARCLRIQDLCLEARTARVTGKLGKIRRVPLTVSAQTALRNYIGDRKTGYVFQQEFPVQKGYLAMTGGRWRGTWTDYRGPGPKYPLIHKYIGTPGTVSRCEAEAQFQKLIAGANLVRPKSQEPISCKLVSDILSRIGRRAGLTHITPHMLRHSFATHLYDHGADLSEIQALLGHSHVRTTTWYARLSTSKMLVAFEKYHPLGINHVKPQLQE